MDGLKHGLKWSPISGHVYFYSGNNRTRWDVTEQFEDVAEAIGYEKERTCIMKRYMPDCGPGKFIPQAFLYKCSECGYETPGRPMGANYCQGCGALVEVWE